MNVQDFLIDSKANQVIYTDGMDCVEQCLNKKHWLEYPHEVSYRYNSKGFRDSEWPADLKSAIWCVGDSFTLGLGQPYEHIWPVILSKQLDVKENIDNMLSLSKSILQTNPKFLHDIKKYTVRVS